MPKFWRRRSNNVTLPNGCENTNSSEDSGRRAVWLGRRPAEKISVGPNGKLNHVGNMVKNVKVNACLTVSRTESDADSKEGLNDPSSCFSGSRM
jgi:hypothetical protein